jgi:hypothetical protein
MFSSDSRYRRSTVLTDTNSAGLPIEVAELRLPPPTEGSFAHVIQEGDRIDNLANKYYREPRKWWRIADANPEFATPGQLLGQAPLRTERIALDHPGAGPAPWAQTLAAAAALVGVARLSREQSYRLSVEPHTVAGERVEVVTEQIDEALLVTYNDLVLELATLIGVFTAAGFTVAGREQLSRVGQPIVIPPDGGT